MRRMPVQPDLFASRQPPIRLPSVQHGNALQLLQALRREVLTALST